MSESESKKVRVDVARAAVSCFVDGWGPAHRWPWPPASLCARHRPRPHSGLCERRQPPLSNRPRYASESPTRPCPASGPHLRTGPALIPCRRALALPCVGPSFLADAPWALPGVCEPRARGRARGARRACRCRAGTGPACPGAVRLCRRRARGAAVPQGRHRGGRGAGAPGLVARAPERLGGRALPRQLCGQCPSTPHAGPHAPLADADKAFPAGLDAPDSNCSLARRRSRQPPPAPTRQQLRRREEQSGQRRCRPSRPPSSPN